LQEEETVGGWYQFLNGVQRIFLEANTYLPIHTLSATSILVQTFGNLNAKSAAWRCLVGLRGASYDKKLIDI